jgi:peptidoglycan/LPS O-acetylase OafA/YrhL
MAVMGVVLTHVLMVSGQVMPWLDNLIHFGSKGVQLFFLVSGLTLTLNYDAGRFNSTSFFVKRFFRIAPMYYLITFIYIIIGSTILPNILPKNLSFFAGMTTLTFTNGWFPSTVNSFSPGAWSIAAEMTFYLLFPLLLRLKGKRWMALTATVVSFVLSLITYKLIVTLMPGKSDYVTYFAYFFWIVQLPAFMSGVCIAAWLPHLQKYANVSKLVFPLSLALVASAAFSRGLTSSYIAADILFSIMVTSGALSASPILRLSLLRHIGTVSFSVYLTHSFFLCVFAKLMPPGSTGYSNEIIAVLTFVAALTAAVLVSSVTYTSIELKGKGLGDALLGRVRIIRERRMLIAQSQ